MLTRSVRSSSALLPNTTRCIHRGVPRFSSDVEPAKEPVSKEQMLTLDWQFEGMLPRFFKANMGALFQRMTKDVDFEDKIFGYKIKDPYNLNIHVLKVRSYFRYKSPFNKVEYLGSVYYEGETMFTVLWRLTSLKSNFLRYFPSFITGKPIEYRRVEGALDIYVNSDARIYKMVNRSPTEEDFESARQFVELKKHNLEEKMRREKETNDRVVEKMIEEKSKY